MGPVARKTSNSANAAAGSRTIAAKEIRATRKEIIGALLLG
jgi:hypothetical protein